MSPCAPPSDERSCCQTALRLFGFVGLTSTHGSSSAFGESKLVGVAPAVQPANGLGPDTMFSGATVKAPALAPAATTSAPTVAASVSRTFLATLIPTSPCPVGARLAQSRQPSRDRDRKSITALSRSGGRGGSRADGLVVDEL